MARDRRREEITVWAMTRASPYPSSPAPRTARSAAGVRAIHNPAELGVIPNVVTVWIARMNRAMTRGEYEPSSIARAYIESTSPSPNPRAIRRYGMIQMRAADLAQ